MRGFIFSLFFFALSTLAQSVYAQEKVVIERNAIYGELFNSFGCSMKKPNPLREYQVWSSTMDDIGEIKVIQSCMAKFPKRKNGFPIFTVERAPTQTVEELALNGAHAVSDVGCRVLQFFGKPSIYEVTFYRLDRPFQGVYKDLVKECFDALVDNE